MISDDPTRSALSVNLRSDKEEKNTRKEYKGVGKRSRLCAGHSFEECNLTCLLTKITILLEFSKSNILTSCEFQKSIFRSKKVEVV